MKSFASPNEYTKKKLTYPRLMQSPTTKNIYLMEHSSKGICIAMGRGNRCTILGETRYYICNLEDYTGSVCLEN